MTPHDASKHWLDHTRNIKRLWLGFLLVLVLCLLAELILELHPQFWLEGIYGFHAWYGFLVCAAMILVAKVLALLLKRPDNYYGKNND